MCDLEQIFGILLAANILLIASIVATGVAIGLNLGVITAGAAPAVFAGALAAGLAANILLLPVTGMIAGCSSGPCHDIAIEAATNFGVAAGSLASGIAIAYIAVLTSAVPVAGTGPMAAYAVFAVMASAFVMMAIDSLRALESCLAAPPPSTESAVVATGAIALAVGVFAGFILYGLFSLGSKKK
jgi:hypothetical protein